ncbi:MAG: hypothetical protein QXU32_08320 [Nitrososphaerales archaeon]
MNRMGYLLAMPLLLALMTYPVALNANVYAQQEPPLSIAPFKRVYSVGMTVTLIGDVSGTFTAGENVSVRVTNPNGQTYQNANARLDEEGSFTFQFKLEGAQASVLGNHTVEVTYKTFNASTVFEVRERPTLSVSVDKTTYDLGDVVTISGKVAPRILEQIEIRIYGFNNTVWKFVPVNAEQIRADGTFTVEAGELLGKNVKPGQYRLEASYADRLATASLQFNVKASGKAVVGRLALVDQSGKSMREVLMGQQVLVQAEVRNNLDERQPFAYLVLIKNSDGITESLSWLSGSLPPSESLSAAQSWVPVNRGSYTVQVFLWDDVVKANPISLKVPQTTVIIRE